MRIVLDSSVIIEGDWNLEHNAARALLGACERGQIELCIPRVVLDEVRNAYEEREARKLQALNGARAALRRMRGPRAGAGELEGKVTPRPGYFGYLRRTITEAGGRVLEYPEVAHQQLLERSLQRRAPFDKAGQRGYRDALIWHNVIELAGSGKPIVFATNDGDFRSDKSADDLHPHLAAELHERSIGAERVTLARSLKEVVERVIEPAAHVRKALGDELGTQKAVRRELQLAMVNSAKRGAVLFDASRLDVAVEHGLEPYAGEVIEKSLGEIEAPHRFAIAEVIPLGDKSFGVEAWLDVTASVALTVMVDGFPGGSPVPSEIEISSDGQSAVLPGSAEVRLVFEIEYDRGQERLGEPQLIEIVSASEMISGGNDLGSEASPGTRIDWFEVAKDEPEGTPKDEEQTAGAKGIEP
jgi:predicted nucleic acid-binding protein